MAEKTYEVISRRDERDFVLENEWDICIPVSFETRKDGFLTVSCFPELQDGMTAFCEKWGKNPFSPAALGEVWQMTAPFLSEWGYEDDRFRDRWGYILKKRPPEKTASDAQTIDPDVSGEFPVTPFPDTRRLHARDEEGNQTTFDLDTSCREGLVGYGTVRAGKVLSLAITHGRPPRRPSTVEVAVETVPSARKGGLACSNLSALTRDLVGRGHTVEYRCQRYNRASYAVARRVGFIEEGKYYFYVCHRIEK